MTDDIVETLLIRVFKGHINNVHRNPQQIAQDDRAIADYKESLRLNPNDPAVYNALAWLQATCPDERCRDGENAVANAVNGNELSGGDNWDHIDTLAAAYAEDCQFDKAVEMQTKAIKLAPETEKERLRSRLELYKHGKPYREEPKKE